jgi:hypothetical protein
VIFKEATGEESEAQLRAFSDSWHWTTKTQEANEYSDYSGMIVGMTWRSCLR